MTKNIKINGLRELILSKSVEIIAENGVRDLSFREVARRANVSHQAPYYYFKNDSEILIAIAKEGFIQLRDDMNSASAKHIDSPIDALTAAGIAYVMFGLNHPGHFRVMFQRTLLPVSTSISQLPEVHDAQKVLRDLTKATFDSGVATSIGLDGLSMLCWSTVHGITNLMSEGLDVAKASKKSNEQIATQVVEGLRTFLKMDVK